MRTEDEIRRRLEAIQQQYKDSMEKIRFIARDHAHWQTVAEEQASRIQLLEWILNGR